MDKALEALKEYQKYNGLRNDLDAYLYQYGQWAMGEDDERPRLED